MKNISKNITIVYLLRFISLLIAYPFIGIIAKYLFHNGIYQIEYFTTLSIWYFFITSLVYALIWAICFYLGSNLILTKMRTKVKIGIISLLIFIVETFIENQHEILKNKTFFNVEIFKTDFLQYLIGQIFTFFIFLYLYCTLARSIIKRTSTLP